MQPRLARGTHARPAPARLTARCCRPAPAALAAGRSSCAAPRARLHLRLRRPRSLRRPGAGSARDRGQAPRAGWGLRASGRGAASRRAGVTPAALPQWVPPPGAGAPTAAVTPGDHPAGGGSTRACDLEKLREGQGLGGGRGPHRK
ncbi:uncharacterized protein LOC110257492 [Sus scrofa]|uniref:uncharacterized protein LOC110257492 n=1 Tax=Sus scrofa TaxID=9823 RepID=UPI000A2B73DF|nr:uncharacterized protein LOC110257492 [Sus scrofa]